MDAQHIETLACRAWPALEEQWVEGWLVRFADGYTRRANSVLPWNGAGGALVPKIAQCEELYRRRGLRPVFRFPSFLALEALDQALAQRGYQRLDTTAVMHRDLQAVGPAPVPFLEVHDEPLDRWLPCYTALHGGDATNQAAHRAILAAIKATRRLATVVVAGEVVGCGLAVLDEDAVGLFDLAIAPHLRKRGYGTALINVLLNWAGECGALHAYLQVVGHNTAARRLYARLGFQERYSYHYRVAPVAIGDALVS